MTISRENRHPVAIGIDKITLATLGLALVDAKQGLTTVLDPGDSLRSKGGDFRITRDDFANTTQLEERLAEISGAKVRLIEKPGSGHFYLLFSNTENQTKELNYVFDVGGNEERYDDTLLITDKKEFSDESLSHLRFPFSPIEDICPIVDGHVDADCYSTHLHYFSACFLFTDSVDQAAALGRVIKANFDSGQNITAEQLDEFFAARRFAVETYDAAIRESARRLKDFAPVQ